MKIVVAPNAFKECLTSVEAAAAIAHGLRRADPKTQIVEVPLADGGDGTMEVLHGALGGRIERHNVTGPLGKPVRAPLAFLAGKGPLSAAFDTADVAGLKLVPARERNPRRATTRGVGEMIRIALGRGAQRVLVGLGGSATVDGGIGMARALGFQLLDARGNPVPEGGRGLSRLRRIAPPPKGEQAWPYEGHPEIIGLCDVENRLLGSGGAAPVYGPQKGATPAMVLQLEAGLKNLALAIERDLGRKTRALAGSGAAGGLGAAIAGILGGELRRGADMILEIAGFEKALRKADLVITGEGRLDLQTLENKAPAAVARIAGEHGVPVIALVGSLDPSLRRSRRRGKNWAGFTACHSIVPGPMPLDEACRRSAELLETASYELGKTLAIVGRARGR